MVEHQSMFGKMSAEDAQWAFQNPKLWMEMCLEAMKNRTNVAKVVNSVFATEYLNLISGGQELVIDRYQGTRIIANSNDVFDFIDPNFRNWRADEIDVTDTPATPVNVFELTKDGNLSDIFGSFSVDYNKLCLTQGQIIGFVEKYRAWLRTDGFGTFFLFKSHGKFFVASVGFFSDVTLGVGVYGLEDDGVFDADCRRRFVVP